MPGKSGALGTYALSNIVLESLAAINAGEPDHASEYFAEDAWCMLTRFSPGGAEVFRGKAQLRAWFHECVSHHQQVEVRKLSTAGNVVWAKVLMWSEPIRRLGVAPLAATDCYSFRETLILSLRRTIDPEPAAKLFAALSHPKD
jgi:SnoaL-like domain